MLIQNLLFFFFFKKKLILNEKVTEVTELTGIAENG